MNIYVTNAIGRIQGVIDSYQSCIWVMQYFGKDEFSLVVDASEKNINLLKPGRYLIRDIDIKSNEMTFPMVIKNYQIDFDVEKGWTLTLTGKGLKDDILGRRVIWNQINHDGTVEDLIRKVIRDNIISPSDSSRRISRLALDSAKGYSETINCQLFSENISDWVEEICKSYNYGWKMSLANDLYLFSIYRGTDRSLDSQSPNVKKVIFSSEYDNLLSSSYSYNVSNYKNAAIVGGEGEGTSQRVVGIGTASGLDRYETYIDGSSVSSNGDIITLETYLQMLEAYGQTQLDQTVFNKNFSGEIKYNGLYKLNEDFFLGDIVSIKDKKGIVADARIIEIIYAEDENGISVVPTFSEWEVN